MRSELYVIYSSRTFKLLVALILALVLIQSFVISFNIENQSNPQGSYRSYDKVYKENTFFIKSLLSSKANITQLPKNIHIGLAYSHAWASIESLPKCQNQIELRNIQASNIDNYIRSYYAYTYCISIKLSNSLWLNYIITPTIGVGYIVTLLSILTLLSLLMLFTYFWMIIKVIIPLKTFQSNAYKLGMSLSKKSIKPIGIKILGDVASSLNFMQAKMFHALELRTKILSAVTHDLKAPITRLKLGHELGLIDSTESLEDIELLEKLCQQILLNAKHDMFNNEDLSRVNVYDFLLKTTTPLNQVRFSANKNAKQSSTITVRSTALKRALDNLISNAVKYGNIVNIRLSVRQDFVYLKIQDDGPGIPEVELKSIFKPFYQANNAQSGHGLGLSIAYEIIINHGGTINISNHNKPHGVIVNVTLPK